MQFFSGAAALPFNCQRWPLVILLFTVFSFVTPGAEPSVAPPKSGWQSLFNGKDLSNWDKFVATSGSSGPLVPNRDPQNVFTVTHLDGGTVIHVSGENYGSITTHDEFENFHARLEFKWGQKRWPPRATVGRDSGILYCCIEKPN